MTKCYVCEKGILKKKKLPYVSHGVFLGEYMAEACSKCGEIFYDEKEFDKMTKEAKKKGVWGIESKTKIAKVGNALDIRLNKNIVQFLKIKKGQEVIVSPENKHKLVVEIC